MTAEDLTGLATSVLVQRTRVLAGQEPVLQSDEYWAHVRVLHFRSGREVFDTSVELCSSQDPISRAVGADVLAQLGVRDGVAAFPFADESEGRLVALLTDSEPIVAASALYARLATSDGASHRSLQDWRSMLQKTFVALSRMRLVAAMTPSPSPR